VAPSNAVAGETVPRAPLAAAASRDLEAHEDANRAEPVAESVVVVAPEAASQPSATSSPERPSAAAEASTVASADKPVWMHALGKGDATKKLLQQGKSHAVGRFLVYMEGMKRILCYVDSSGRPQHLQVKTSVQGMSLGK
jgi:hypothetical protein